MATPKAPGKDSDGDGYLDVDEPGLGLDPTRFDGPFPNDADKDGLTDTAERAYGTNPNQRDSDGDGIADGVEVTRGTSPTDRSFGAPLQTPTRLQVPDKQVEITPTRQDPRVADFLNNVLAQVGDRYQRGAEASLKDANPEKWDGSELVEWGANRAGVVVNDGAANQYGTMVRDNSAISPDKALEIPGAILYQFTGDPKHPTKASTAISLGDGNVIDIDPTHGVRIRPASEFTFTHAGIMNGFVDAAYTDATAVAAREAAYQKWGIDPTDPSTFPIDPGRDAAVQRAGDLGKDMGDKVGGGLVDPASQMMDPTPTGTPPGMPTPTPPTDPVDPTGTTAPPAAPAQPDRTGEGAALETRAADLRAKLLEQQGSDERFYQTARRDAERELKAAGAELAESTAQLNQAKSLAQTSDESITILEKSLQDAVAAKDETEAQELRETLDKARMTRKVDAEQIAHLEAEQQQLAQVVVAKDARVKEIADIELKRYGDRLAAENNIDALENKAALLKAGKNAEADAVVVDENAFVEAYIVPPPPDQDAGTEEAPPLPPDDIIPTRAVPLPVSVPPTGIVTQPAPAANATDVRTAALDATPAPTEGDLPVDPRLNTFASNTPDPGDERDFTFNEGGDGGLGGEGGIDLDGDGKPDGPLDGGAAGSGTMTG